MESSPQPDSLKEQLIALRDQIRKDGEKLRRMLAEMETKQAGLGTARPSFSELVGREEFAALGARVAKLEKDSLREVVGHRGHPHDASG
jgi:hypothetical protein